MEASLFHCKAFVTSLSFRSLGVSPFHNRPSQKSITCPRTLGLSQIHQSRTIVARRPVYALANAGDEKKDGIAGEVPEDLPGGDAFQPATPTQAIDPVATKKRLLKILSVLINLGSQRGKVEQLVMALESLKNAPVTESFTEMALAGDWLLLFSSTTTLTDGNVRIREIGQSFNPDEKKLTNRALWSYVSKDLQYEFWAELLVICTYKCVGPARLQVTIDEHKVTVQKKDGVRLKVPKDMQPVVVQMQRTLPVEFFNPSGLLEVSYIEPDFRIARFLGKRVAGVRNIFVRPTKEL